MLHLSLFLRTLHSVYLKARHAFSALTLAAGLLAFSSAGATTILGMDIDKVVADAEFVFEGEVIHSETRQDSASGIISTYVTFQIRDIVKGEHSGESLELKFMGGVFDGQVVQVAGMRIPELNEQGIYFVESLSRDLINPLIGWSQGHFIIVDDNGERRISTASKEPVMSVDSVSSIPSSIKKPLSVAEGDSDVAAGVSTQVSPLQVQRALTVDEFKSRISDLLAN